ncbi:hypothetical protein [Pedobacter psychrotolerans]|uniref:hypothetical protein n=1 Tax=Pedobacter psychrotolerans TaxID=1843235 RepID=UPI003F9501DE
MDILNQEFNIVPYQSVGPIRFGMSRKEIETLFGKPQKEIKDMLERSELIYGDLSIKLAKKSGVNEVSFSKDPSINLTYNDLNIFQTEDIIKKLDQIEKPFNTVGFKVFFEIGLALTGFSKKKDDKTASVFAKELIALWKM